MVRLTTPIDKETVRSLGLGQMALINGVIYTGRDRLHRFLAKERPEVPFRLEGGIIYHCGPILKRDMDTYSVVAAGPTTSSRMDVYTPDLIRHYGVSAIIGKGGMGEETIRAMAESGCVYMNTINGAAAYLADRVKSVYGSWKIEEFGTTEALWALEVEEFPVFITIDFRGNSLHRQIRDLSYSNLRRLFTKGHD